MTLGGCGGLRSWQRQLSDNCCPTAGGAVDRELSVERGNTVGGIFINETPPEQVAADLRRALGTP